MNTITQRMKSAAGTNGAISIEKAMAIAKEFDQEREATRELLKQLETLVGTYHGEKIQRHIAEMDGTGFNEVAYHYDRPVGEQ